MTRSLFAGIRRSTASPLAFFAMAYGATATLQKGLGFALFLWLAHSLSVQEYATFGLLFALQTVLATLAVAGVIESVIGLLKDHDSAVLRGELFGAANAVFAILGVPSIALVAVIYAFLMRDTSDSFLNLQLIVLTGILTAFFALQASLSRLEEKHVASLALSFLVPLAGFVGGAIGFVNGRTVTSFFAGSAVGLLFPLIPLAFYGVGSHGFAARSNQIPIILSRIAPFILIAVLGWLAGYGNTYLVKSFFTATDVAKFTFAYTMSSIMQLVATSLNQVWGPRFFRMVHELPIEQVEERNKRFFTLQGVALGIVGAGVLVVLPAALEKIGGNLSAYRGMNIELLLLFSAYALSIPWWHAQNFYYAHNKGKELMRVTVVSSIVGLLLWLLSIWLFGVTGVYVGFMMQMIARMLGAVIWARKEWEIKIAWQGTTVALCLLIAGAAFSATTQ